VSDDPENMKNVVEPTSPSPEQEQKPASEPEATIPKLSEALAEEEQSQEKLPKKAGFIQRVTGALHLRPGLNRKTGQLPPAVEKYLSIDQPVASTPEVRQENKPETDVPTASVATGETATDEKGQRSPYEGSIFDLLAQVQKGGLLHDELPEAEKKAEEPVSDKTELPQMPSPESEPTLPPSLLNTTGSDSGVGGPTPQDIMPTSTLASRLWGLQELPSDLDKLPPSEPETMPSPDEKGQSEPQESGDKRSFFDRLKGQRGEEKDANPLQIDDDEVIDRITRTTGTLHAPSDSSMPGRPSRVSRVPDELQPVPQDEKEDSDTSRFTYFPQEGNEPAPNAPGEAVVDSKPISSFHQEPLANQPASDTGSNQEVAPFPYPGEGWIPPQTPVRGTSVSTQNQSSVENTTPSMGESFDIDQFLGVSKTDVQPEQKESLPQEENALPGPNLEEIRSIALAESEEGEIAALPSPEALPEEAAAVSTERKTSKKGRSWWASLSTFEKILLGITVLLITSIAVIAIITANNFGTHKPEATIQPTTTPSALPHPAFIILPGGWSFALNPSGLDTPLNASGTGAWLQGSEVRRVVELPWNKQTEAVIHSFVTGDPIQLVFDNNTTITYKVQQILRVGATDTSILTDVKPSLAVILAGENSDNRWVIIGMP
jgi:hypothetical protein